ncbi:hypothetical protein VTL71DRAFT_4838 [Oculimacula yallundae]|uniref:Uncharacterized protein n=1 Tax=Oculimacula yallundae TaxID=86028 RepID=A0ABR4C359_9HELO
MTAVVDISSSSRRVNGLAQLIGGIKPSANSFIFTIHRCSDYPRAISSRRLSRPGAISHKLRKQIQVCQSQAQSNTIHAPKVQPPSQNTKEDPARKQAARLSRKTIKRYYNGKKGSD